MLFDNYMIGAIFFFILSVLVIIRNIKSERLDTFIWFCDIAPFALFTACLIRDDQIIKAIINVGFIPQIISSVSLFAVVFLGVPILGFRDILNYSKFHIAVSFLLHFVSTVFAIFLTYDIQPQVSSLAYSLVILVLLLFLSLMFTRPKDNINYVHNTDFLGFSIPYYKFLWVPLAFIVIVLPTYFLQYILYILSA